MECGERTAIADLLVTLICAAVVAVHAWDRYNTPKSNRVSTTRAAFLFTGAGYISASLILFLFLSHALKPSALPKGVLAVLELEGIEEILKNYCAPPVLAAVILTVLLPHTPVISSADDWLLKRFQAWGSIPQGVRNLAGKLAPQALQLKPADVAQLQAWIEAEEELPNELTKIVSADPAETSRGSVTRILRIYRELQNLETAPGYQSAFRSWQDVWQGIKEDFHVFLAETQAFFVLFEQLSPLEGTAGEAALARAKKCYRDICRKMHRDATEFLAQLLLMVEGSDQRIGNRLQAIGFAAPPQPGPRLQVGPFVFMGAMMIFGMLGIVSLGSPHPGQGLPPAVTAVLIGATRTIGILTAILPKLRWSQSCPDDDGNPPHLAWLGWAGAAALLSLLIERSAYAIASGNLDAGLEFGANPVTPMAPMAFSTSLVLSILCDVDFHLGHGLPRRVSEGLLAAVAGAFSIYLCIHLLLLTAAAGQLWSPMPYVISSGLGFVSGFFAPHLYRRARGEAPAAQLSPIHSV